MKTVAIIHILFIALGPVGAVVILRWKGSGARAGLAMIALGVLGVFALSVFSPFDFLFPNGATRISTRVHEFTVEAVQLAGDDFYDSYFRVTDADGRVAMFLIDSDDRKWWQPSFKRAGNRVYISTLLDFGDPSGGFVDLRAMSFNAPASNRSIAFSELSFD